MIVVLAVGCFDVIHAGHARHLQAAKNMGDVLIVGLTEDVQVTKEKGAPRPYMAWADRAAVLKAFEAVSSVIPCSSGAAAIYGIRPNIYCKGIDYRQKGLRIEELDACYAVGAEVRFTDTEKRSSTELIKRIKQCAA